ncbi:MAG: hypothetical protein QMC96_06120 [Methanomicrobiales archaeon]|nr:hypothetical protein [Methanomicrobiales archaeon]
MRPCEDLVIVRLPSGYTRPRRDLLRDATDRWGPLKTAIPGVRMTLDALQQFSRDLLVICHWRIVLGALAYRRDYYDPGLLKMTDVGVVLRRLGLGTALVQAAIRVACEQRRGITLNPIDDAARAFFARWGMHERREGDQVHLELSADEVHALAEKGPSIPLVDEPPLPDRSGSGTGGTFR